MNDSQSKRAAIYCRVSTSGQEQEGTSLQTQEEACRKYAAEHGYTVDEPQVYREVFTGSELWDRPQLSLLREAARRRAVDMIVAYAIDRLSRDPVHLGVVLSEADHAGVGVDFVSEVLDDSPEGQLIRFVRGYAAKVEHTKIQERTRRGKVARAQGGRPLPGPRPRYGYCWDDPRPHQKNRLLVDEQTAPIVRRLFSDVAAGVPVRRIVDCLSAEGVPSPGGKQLWRRATIIEIVRDPIYSTGKTGSFRHKWAPFDNGQDGRHVVVRPAEEWVTLPDVPMLVDATLQEAAIARLAYNKETAARRCLQPENYLLRAGFVFCATCGRPMRLNTRRDCDNRYLCPGGEPGEEKCPHRPSISTKRLDNSVWQDVMAYLLHPELIEAELAKKMHDDATIEGDLAAVERVLAAVAREERNLVTNLAQLDADSTGAMAIRELLAAKGKQHKSLQGERENVLRRRAAWEVAQARLADLQVWCRQVAANLANADYEHKRMALLALGVRVTVWPAGREPRYDIDASIRLDAFSVRNLST
ncbi:MAG: recombinase family protein [Chloroflexi bacterium]|nr:recombinase family protein [Chloroflexota bacterium]MCL5107773.1 recombinase family protein [Chloroflexota bacterium]